MHNVGDRVGAILSMDESSVKLLGFGVYDGDLEPPMTPVGVTQGQFEEMTGSRFLNPRITLDNGSVVWGYQCWWGSESDVRAKISGRTIVEAKIED